jgi:anaerobic magnesium-protoporphyrin IX monomethyl ester cyclase
VAKAVKAAKKAGVDTFGFFIFGLKDETEDSLKKTIDFAKKLPLDIAKFDICIPYPGTAYYEELSFQGRIISRDWTKYICHQVEEPLFDHPNLAWDVIEKYYKRAFREYYLRPGYVFQRVKRDLLKGDFLYDLKYFIQTKW